MSFLKNSYYKMLSFMPKIVVLNIENIRGYKKIIDLQKPLYFGEKIQWLKINGNLNRYKDYTDKIKVREYVSNKIGSQYLNEITNIWDNVDQINFDTLPNKFVLKLNHGCGYNMICDDKLDFDRNKAKKILKKWQAEDFSKIKKEPQYSGIKPLIYSEKFLEDGNEELTDYKLFCFNGKVEFVQVITNRKKITNQDFFDANWNKLDLRKGGHPNSKKELKKPKKLSELIRLSEKLSKDFPFVRVDFYIINNSPIFGELTFTPAGGLSPFEPLQKDIEIARLINLKKYI